MTTSSSRDVIDFDRSCRLSRLFPTYRCLSKPPSQDDQAADSECNISQSGCMLGGQFLGKTRINCDSSFNRTDESFEVTELATNIRLFIPIMVSSGPGGCPVSISFTHRSLVLYIIRVVAVVGRWVHTVVLHQLAKLFQGESLGLIRPIPKDAVNFA